MSAVFWPSLDSTLFTSVRFSTYIFSVFRVAGFKMQGMLLIAWIKISQSVVIIRTLPSGNTQHRSPPELPKLLWSSHCTMSCRLLLKYVWLCALLAASPSLYPSRGSRLLHKTRWTTHKEASECVSPPDFNTFLLFNECGLNTWSASVCKWYVRKRAFTIFKKLNYVYEFFMLRANRDPFTALKRTAPLATITHWRNECGIISLPEHLSRVLLYAGRKKYKKCMRATM